MKRLALLLLLATITLGCPYYNTFYNAKRAFSEAEDLRKDALKQGITQVPQQAVLLYERAIENSALLMRDHPTSDLIDDALVLIGDAFEIQAEYPKAIRKYEEVLANYPDSKWFPYCAFALGKTTLNSGDTLRAEESLRDFLRQYPASEWAPESHMLLGSIDISRQDYSLAVADYTDFLTSFPKHKRRAEAQYFIAESYLELDRHLEALELFERVGQDAPTRDLEYQAKYMVGECLRRDTEYERALETFEGLVAKSSYIIYRPKTLLAIASCKASLGRKEEAIGHYETINERYERDRQYEAEVSEAIFEMGRLSEQAGDLVRADELYESAGKRSPRQFWVAREAGKRSSDIRLLTRYREDLEGALSEGLPALADSTDESRSISESAPDSASLAKIVSSRFKVAEVFLFQFGMIDSALAHYSLAEEAAGGGLQAAKAAYAKAWVMEHVLLDTSSSRVGYTTVMSQYDTTVYASAAARAMEMQDPLGFSETELFALATDYLFEAQNSDSAAVYYQTIIDRFPDGSYAPKSLYALGWIAETHEEDLSAALMNYRRITALFPRSEASEAARLKVKYLEELFNDINGTDSSFVEIESVNEFLLSIDPEDRDGEVTEVIRDRVVMKLNQDTSAQRGGRGILFIMDRTDSTEIPIRAASFRILDTVIPEGPRMGTNTAVNTNLYAGKGDRTITMVTPRRPFEVLGEDGEWIQIRFEGMEGYVNRQFVNVDPLVIPTATATIEERFPAWTPDEWIGVLLDGSESMLNDDSPPDSAGTALSANEPEESVPLEITPDGDVLSFEGDRAVVKVRSTLSLSEGDGGVLYLMDSDGRGRTAARIRVAQIRLPDLGMGTVTVATELRSTPDGEVLMPIPKGIAVVALAEEGSMLKVRIGSNEGYVPSTVVRMIPPDVPYRGTVDATSLNLRETPGGPVIRLLPSNSSVQVTGIQGNWLAVEIEGQKAYVAALYIKPDPMSDQLVYCYIESASLELEPDAQLSVVFDVK
ncbi:MAG: tetratricopeptide repeat protein [Candidatus Latescibacteria bacterium]|nr:tetratricopeptide repeat protein [Candidatus Latescibacterota bacterium]